MKEREKNKTDFVRRIFRRHIYDLFRERHTKAIYKSKNPISEWRIDRPRRS